MTDTDATTDATQGHDVPDGADVSSDAGLQVGDARLSALSWTRADLRFPVVVFALHWVFFTLIGALATHAAQRLATIEALGYRLPELDGWQRLVVQPWRNWDGFWYGLIADHGYDAGTAATAFWPLYPWTVRYVSHLGVLSYTSAGVLLSNLAFLLALVVLHQLVRREFGAAAAGRTLWLLAFAPVSFFFGAMYSESFFLLFAVLAFFYALGGRYWLAGLAAALAGLTRNLGLLLALPIGLLFVQQYGWDPRRWPRSWLAVGMPALGALVFGLVLWQIWGDPLTTLEAQQGWAREQALPHTTVQMALDQLDLSWARTLVASPTWTTLTSFEVRHGFAESEALDVVAFIGGVALLVLAARRLPLAYSAWCGVMMLVPLLSPSTVHPLMSTPRFLLVLFPLTIALALVLERRAVFFAVLLPSIVLGAMLATQFATWYWVA